MLRSLVEAQYPCACSASLIPDRVILVRAQAGDIMLCSRERQLVTFLVNVFVFILLLINTD